MYNKIKNNLNIGIKLQSNDSKCFKSYKKGALCAIFVKFWELTLASALSIIILQIETGIITKVIFTIFIPKN